MKPSRNLYPTDVSDDEWAFVAPYLIVLPEDAGQRTYSLREVFNGLCWITRAGAPWRMMPNDLPPWWVVYQPTQRWLAAGCFSALVVDLRLLLREYERLPITLVGFHLIVFTSLMLDRWLATSSPSQTLLRERHNRRRKQWFLSHH